MAYVPPHLRNKASTTPSKPENVPQLRSVRDIHHHFWSAKDPEDTGGREYNVQAIPSTLKKTMHGSAESPNELAFVMLFHGANPRWESDRIIFTKSNLDLLPGQTPAERSGGKFNNLVGAGSDDTLAGSDKDGEAALIGHGEELSSKLSAKPIAIFRQVSNRRHDEGFEWEGWYNVKEVEILQARSPELVRMLEQKWTKTDKRGNAVIGKRDARSWQSSLEQKWAVVKFVKDEDAEQNRKPPDIEKLPPEEPKKPEQPNMGVNEMLAEMRLKDSDV